MISNVESIQCMEITSDSKGLKKSSSPNKYAYLSYTLSLLCKLLVMARTLYTIQIQWNLNLGPGLLSFIKRLSFLRGQLFLYHKILIIQGVNRVQGLEKSNQLL